MLVNESGQLGCTSNSGNLRFRILTEELDDKENISTLLATRRVTRACLERLTR